MKASKQLEEQPFLKVCLYGHTGTGKTTWASLAPKPLFILTERQALYSIAFANPMAEVEVMNSLDDLERILESLNKGCPAKTEDGQPAFAIKHDGEEIVFQTLVVDSLSVIQDTYARAYKHRSGKMAGQVDWIRTQDKMRVFLDSLRLYPCNVINLCLAKEKTDRDNNWIGTYPKLSGSIGEHIGQWHNAIGYSSKREGKQGDCSYGIYWERYDDIVTKKAHGFPSSMPVDLDKRQVSLGSLSLAAIGPKAVHEPGDSADHVKP